MPVSFVKLDTAGLLKRWAGAPRWLTGLAIVALFLLVALLGVNRLPFFAKLEAIAYDARLLATQPNTGDPLRDHRDCAIWLGRSHTLNLRAHDG